MAPAVLRSGPHHGVERAEKAVLLLIHECENDLAIREGNLRAVLSPDDGGSVDCAADVTIGWTPIRAER